MSSPTSSFSRLSLSRMPTTRAESRRQPPPPHSSDEDESDNDNADDSSPEVEAVVKSTHTKLRYDISRLSPTTEERAKAGLKEPFTLGHCAVYNPNEKTEYFAFQIFEAVNFSVRIGAPESEYRELTCHCDDDHRPCRHIFWLLDQMAQHTLTDAQKESLLTLSKNGYPLEAVDPYHQITTAGPRLFQELDCELRTDGTFEDPETSSDASEDRIKDVRDILSSFSSVTRDEYRPDIFNNIPSSPTTDQGLLVPQDLEKTLAWSMIANDDFFRHMRSLVPSSHCAADLFQKKQAEAKIVLEKLDKYIAKRPNRPETVHDIPWCGNHIVQIVNSIMARINEARTPLSLHAKQRAAETLSLILLWVSQRNIDVYASPVWARSRQQALPLNERNLFARLFGSAPPGTDRFIVDNLTDLGDAVAPFVHHLEEALEKFTANKAPKVYIDKLATLVKSPKSGALVEAQSSRGSKRPGKGGDWRDHKREKMMK
jgi:hypothetical protein